MDEQTRMIGKLGYVPPEARHEPGNDDLDADRLFRDDGVKYRARKRGKKTSTATKLLIGGLAVLVLAVLVGGIWWLTTDTDETQDAGPTETYQALDDPCAPLDHSVLDDISTEINGEPRTGSDTVGDKTSMNCSVNIGSAEQVGALVSVDATVYGGKSPDARARSEFKHQSGKYSENSEEELGTLDGDWADAFTVVQPWNEETGATEYQLHLYDANAFVSVRVTVFDENSPETMSGYAKTIAEKYLSTWRG